MNFSSLIGVELTKIRRSKIFLILLAPVLMMWLPSVINSDMIFDVRGVLKTTFSFKALWVWYGL